MGREQQKDISTYLIWAAAFLHNVLRPTNFGLHCEVKLSMPPWAIHFKVSTVIQAAN